MLRRSCAVFRGFWRDFEIVALRFGVGKLADRLDIFPLAGVNGIFRALDQRKSIDRMERDMKLPTLDRRCQILDARRGCIHLKPAAFLRRRQGFTGRVRRRIRGNYFHCIAAIRQQAGIEGIRLVGEIVLEEQPARFAVAAVVDGVDELVVVLIVRAPLHSDRVAIARTGS